MDEKPQDFWQANQQALSDEELPVEPQSPAAPAPGAQSLSWEASEYILHEKDITWYIGVAVIGLLLVVISLFFLQSLTFTVLIAVMMVAVLVLATRPPRTLRFQLSPGGLQIDEKKYDFASFRAFGVQQEGGLYSILLIPVQRFMPSVSVYFPPDQGEEIVDMIGSYVPMEKIEPDLIDTLTRKLRF